MDCKADGRTLLSVLQALNFEKDQLVHWATNKDGVKLRAETKAKEVNACCWLPALSFREFRMEEEGTLEFAIAISSLLNALQLFGIGANVRLHYSADAAIFRVLLAEDRAVSECSLRVQPSEGLSDTDVPREKEDEETEASRDSFILKSEILRDALQDMQEEDPEMLVIVKVAPATPQTKFVLSLAAAGKSSATQWDLPYDTRHFHRFDVLSGQKLRFSLRCFLHLQRPLYHSKTCKITIGPNSRFKAETFLRTDKGCSSLLQFHLNSRVDEDEELNASDAGEAAASRSLFDPPDSLEVA